jgi:hypothetical protein
LPPKITENVLEAPPETDGYNRPAFPTAAADFSNSS